MRSVALSPNPLLSVGIALGSNLGDRLANLRAGRAAAERWHRGDRPAAVSAVYETEPVDCPPGSAPFLNAVMEIQTSLQPAELLARLRAVEIELGRATRAARNAPRPLDLDILYAGDLLIDTLELSMPHPRMTTRRFVLQPLSDIRPDLVLPGQEHTIAALLAALPPRPAATVFTTAW
jgi:2-amino-4-hydroxy-6-hydroxymethyldihydropteridine diphosphokinase